jgi:hypothetical protein
MGDGLAQVVAYRRERHGQVVAWTVFEWQESEQVAWNPQICAGGLHEEGAAPSKHAHEQPELEDDVVARGIEGRGAPAGEDDGQVGTPLREMPAGILMSKMDTGLAAWRAPVSRELSPIQACVCNTLPLCGTINCKRVSKLGIAQRRES